MDEAHYQSQLKRSLQQRDFHLKKALEYSHKATHPEESSDNAFQSLIDLLKQWCKQGRPPSQSRRAAIPREVRQTVLQLDEFGCRRCGSGSDLTVDHITPIAKGGSNDVSNLQTLCRSCNSSKGKT
ncbi:hypothetical protein LCGC14_0249990 [marine sediment metagenome]|uniref:HNH nuclease domain-containing protein n=1 Tax=marine sediment metagenome TaxID=412755 RepID=A0A0F9WQF4_9ZZZZ